MRFNMYRGSGDHIILALLWDQLE